MTSTEALGAYQNGTSIGSFQLFSVTVDADLLTITLSIPAFTTNLSESIKKFSYIEKDFRKINRLSNVIAIDFFNNKIVFLID